MVGCGWDGWLVGEFCERKEEMDFHARGHIAHTVGQGDDEDDDGGDDGAPMRIFMWLKMKVYKLTRNSNHFDF